MPQDGFQKALGKAVPLKWSSPVAPVFQGRGSNAYVEYLLFGWGASAPAELVESVGRFRVLSVDMSFPGTDLRLVSCEHCPDSSFGISGFSGAGNSNVESMKSCLQKCPCARFLEQRLTEVRVVQKTKRARTEEPAPKAASSTLFAKLKGGNAGREPGETYFSSEDEEDMAAKKSQGASFKRRAYACGMSEDFWKAVLEALRPPAVVCMVLTHSAGAGLLAGLLLHNEAMSWTPSLLALPAT